MLVKICGVRSISMARTGAGAGADFLGFNFVPSSRRKVTISQARKIIESLPKKNRPSLVGVFQNQPLTFVKKTASALGLDYVQLHGQESPLYCKKLKNIKIIKAFGMHSNFKIKDAVDEMKKYEADLFMADRANRGQGDLLKLKNISSLSKKYKVILAGGLAPAHLTNVKKSVPQLFAVDVAGGIETNGQPDLKKIKQFVKLAKT